MALNFLGGGSGGGAKFFDIRLDNDYIMFRGNEDEAASAQVNGSVVLCLTEPLTIKHIKLTLSGINRMSWLINSSSSMTGKRPNSKERTFFNKEWTFQDPGKNKTETLKPGNYEFPFDLILEGKLPESVEGLKENWVIYRFKAEIGRKYAKDTVVRKPLRIVRMPDASALELSHAMSVENIWPNKIDYTISTPTKAIVFGTALQVDFRLVPLLKGLVIGQIITQLKEEQEFVPDPEFHVAACNSIRKLERIICQDTYELGDESDPQILDEEAEGFQFSRYLELPKSLNKCLQDCNVQGIKIRHKIKFTIQLHNPDGHMSELRANLPVQFYISPSLPVDENNDLIDQSLHASWAAIQNDLTQSAPPLYGQHELDHLYSDVDPSGYRTPGNALSTPGTPYTHSRNISSENLVALEAITNAAEISTSSGGHQVNPRALEHRLQNLRFGNTSSHSPLVHEDRLSHNPENGDQSPANMARSNSGGPDYFSTRSSSGNHSHGNSPQNQPQVHINGIASVPGSTPVSRRTSQEDQYSGSGTQTPIPQFHHMEDLTRVPSYTTAVRTPANRMGSVQNDGLPSYAATTSMAGSSDAAGLTVPQNVHTRPGPANRQMDILQDGERRLNLLRARGR